MWKKVPEKTLKVIEKRASGHLVLQLYYSTVIINLCKY